MSSLSNKWEPFSSLYNRLYTLSNDKFYFCFRPFTEDVLSWMPVDMYIGGIEHGRNYSVFIIRTDVHTIIYAYCSNTSFALCTLYCTFLVQNWTCEDQRTLPETPQPGTWAYLQNILYLFNDHLCRDLAKASKRGGPPPFYGKFSLMWSIECVKTANML